jgi:hypothetical protein
MGIYTSGEIFGIRIYTFSEDDLSKTLYEQQYDEIMSFNQMREAYLFYVQLYDKSNIHFQFYTDHSTSYNPGSDKYMGWHPLALNTFLEKFSI